MAEKQTIRLDLAPSELRALHSAQSTFALLCMADVETPDDGRTLVLTFPERKYAVKFSELCLQTAEAIQVVKTTTDRSLARRMAALDQAASGQTVTDISREYGT